MKHDLELKVQALLDGELSEREAARIGGLIVGDAEASALAAELRQIKQTIAGNEAVPPVPASREFYWNAIQRQIRQAEQVPVSASSRAWKWRRWLMPAACAAALTCAFLITHQELQPPTFDEISASDEGMEAVTFHDQAAGMTVVWLEDRPQAAPAVPSASANPTSIPDPGESEVEVE